VQVSDFIVASRLNAKIDKAANVIETAPSFERTTHYQALIKEGDLLLNRLQKLSKIVDVE
jgi:26S proteasome regulatory subunit N7